MRRAAFSHEDGYQTGRSRPAAPQASPGSSSTGARAAAPRRWPARPVPAAPAWRPGSPARDPGPQRAEGRAQRPGGAPGRRGRATQPRRPAPSASARASGAMNCWPSRSTANPGQKLLRARSRSRPGAVTPRLAMASPAAAAIPSPGQRRAPRPESHVPGRRRQHERQPQRRPPAAVPRGHVWAFHIAAEHQQAAERAERGVRAGGERRHTGPEAYTGRIRDGISHGRLPHARGPPARSRPTRSRRQDRDYARASRAEDGRRAATPAPEMVIAANPPTTAGSSARPSRPAPRQDATGRGHRAQGPGQAGVTEQQRPLADDEPLGHERVPGVEDTGGQPREPRLAGEQAPPRRSRPARR